MVPAVKRVAYIGEDGEIVDLAPEEAEQVLRRDPELLRKWQEWAARRQGRPAGRSGRRPGKEPPGSRRRRQNDVMSPTGSADVVTFEDGSVTFSRRRRRGAQYDHGFRQNRDPSDAKPDSAVRGGPGAGLRKLSVAT